MQPVKASDSAYDRDNQNLIYDVTELPCGTERNYVAGTRFQIRVTASEAEVPFPNIFRYDSYLLTSQGWNLSKLSVKITEMSY